MAIIGETPRQKALKQLAGQMPVANQQVAQGLQAARTIGLQQQLGQAPAGTSVRVAQQAGAQQAAQAGQIAAQEAQKTQGDLLQLGQLGLQERGRALRQEEAGQQFAQARQQMAAESALNKLGTGVKQELFDKQMEFKTDEMGRTRFKDRQLIDWAILKSQKGENFQDYAQFAEQTAKRQQQIMEMAYKKVQQGLEQGYLGEKQKLDQASRVEIAKMLAEAKKAQEKRAAAAKNKQAMWSAAGTVVGAAAGAVIGASAGGVGAPAGAMVGASIGSGIGTMASGLGE